MRKKLFLISLFTLLVTIVLSYVNSNKNKVGNLIGPNLSIPSQTPSPAPAPPQAPKTFKFDSSTDLEAELQKVNPQVLDSDFDFEQLQSMINSL